jgi:acyl-CoA synthetase (AMP-forming)/AMP-acid ligase II
MQADPAREQRRDRYRALGLWSDASVGGLVAGAAARWPEREAIAFEGVRLRWRELHAWSCAVARWLVARGIGAGDRVLWQLPNGLEGLALHLAAWRIGAVAVPVVPIYREHEMRHILAQVRPDAVAFADSLSGRRPVQEMQELLRELDLAPRLRIAVGGAPPGWESVPAFDSALDERGLPAPADADACCLILYTSGTTSAPKGAMHGSRSLLATAALWRRKYGFVPDDCFIMGAPITHIGGLLTVLVAPAACGARVVLLPAWDAERATSLCERERVSFCSGATVFLQGFVEHYERGGSPSHRLTRFMCGGAGVPPSMIERAAAVGIGAWRCWGMTEAPTTTLASPDDPLELRARRDGFPTEGCEVEAVDTARRPLARGEAGELRIRCPQQMQGYSDPAVHAAQTDADGWFYTGDVGRVDAEGWVTMTGRLKDIINRGGEKFSAQDIEYSIASHPAVGQVAVLGVPDARLGEAVAAFVVPRPGVAWPGERELLRHLEAQRLARQKLPVHWQLLPELPMTASGKVQKHRLLEAWERGPRET